MSVPVISDGGSGLPSRIVCHGVEGVGKSSFGAFCRKPVFGMARGETGLLTLIDSGLVPPTKHFNEFQSWEEVEGAVNYLIAHETPFQSLVIDTLNGVEKLFFEYQAKALGFGPMKAFMNFGRGPELSQQPWGQFLALLDRLRLVRKMQIIWLCHSKIKTFKNPEGDDYDRYTPDVHEKIWALTHRWADVVLFANFETHAKREQGDTRAKAVSDGTRVLYTQRTAAWDAKNRHNLPPQILMGRRPHESWANFAAAMRAGRKQQQKAAPVNGNGNGQTVESQPQPQNQEN